MNVCQCQALAPNSHGFPDLNHPSLLHPFALSLSPLPVYAGMCLTPLVCSSGGALPGSSTVLPIHLEIV